MEKYALLRKRVQEACLVPVEDLVEPAAASVDQLLRVHHRDYVERVLQGILSEKEVRRIGFPWSLQLVERSRRSVGGTIAACRSALEDGLSVNLAGGTHHACAGHGEGFCVFNDCAVAARVLQAEGAADRVILIDLDVHQGNGSASIFSGDDSVYTFSIHGEKNFPFHKEVSSLDIALPDRTGDESYLGFLKKGLQQALVESRSNLAIYLAGADPYEGDRLGRMALTKAGLVRRDRMVFSACKDAGLPVAVVMAGGYARDINDTVDIQFNTVELAVSYAMEPYGRPS